METGIDYYRSLDGRSSFPVVSVNELNEEENRDQQEQYDEDYGLQGFTIGPNPFEGGESGYFGEEQISMFHESEVSRQNTHTLVV